MSNVLDFGRNAGGLILSAILLCLFLLGLIHAWRTGRVMGRFRMYDRRTEPFDYFVRMSFLVGFFILLAIGYCYLLHAKFVLDPSWMES